MADHEGGRLNFTGRIQMIDGLGDEPHGHFLLNARSEECRIPAGFLIAESQGDGRNILGKHLPVVHHRQHRLSTPGLCQHVFDRLSPRIHEDESRHLVRMQRRIFNHHGRGELHG